MVTQPEFGLSWASSDHSSSSMGHGKPRSGGPRAMENLAQEARGSSLH